MPDRVSIAMVLADGVATTYWRGGSGRTVVLLGASGATAVALSASFRVIAPEVPFPLPDASAARWLAGVCEGLGIVDAALVTAPALSDAATRFAQDAPERVRGVLVAASSSPDAAELRAAVERVFG